LLRYINQDTVFNGLRTRIAGNNLVVFIHVSIWSP
jgi:hypothetical protein